MFLSVTLFGQLRVKIGDQLVKSFRSKKAEALLIYLMCSAHPVQTREALIDLFWPNQPMQKGFANLRQTLRRLQNAIDNTTADPPFLLIDEATVQFNRASHYQLDFQQFQSLLSGCGQHQPNINLVCHACMANLRQAEMLYGTGFLPYYSLDDAPSFDQWLEGMREEIDQKGATLFQQMADYHEQRGEYKDAARYARRVVEINSWDETSARQRMRLLARQGKRVKALKLYRSFEKQLKTDIGDDVEPTLETRNLYVKIRTTPQDRPHTLPSLFGRTFIGREQELADIKMHLAHPQYRLLTLAGLGGIGKTELSLQVGWAAVNDHFGPFIDGVHFIDTPENQDAVIAFVTQIASALKINIAGRSRPKSYLLNCMAKKECLILIDNGENIDAHGRDFIVQLLEQTSTVKLLVASRHRLKIRGETLFPITGLPFPKPNENLSKRHASVACFEARATQIDTTFNPNTQDQEAIIKITQLTEGLPLALKLAASWIRLLSCTEIAYKIEESIKNLATTLEDEVLRHRSIWGVFNQAWEIINQDERLILANLAVFKGGFSQHAAQEIIGASPTDLANLLDFSLLERRPFATVTELRLHPLLRQYLQEKRPIEPSIIEKHARYYGKQLEQLSPQVDSPELANVFATLDQMWSDVQAGWSSAVALQDLSLVSHYANALHDLLTVKGWALIGAEMFQQAAKLLPDKEMIPQATKEELSQSTGILARLGNFLTDIGQLAQAESTLHTSLMYAAQIEEETELRFVYSRLILLSIKRGEWARAQQLVTLARQMNEERVPPLIPATQYMNEAVIAYHQGQFDSAKEAIIVSIDHFKQAKATWGEGHARRWLGVIQYQLGNYTDSTHQLNLSSKIHNQQQDMLGYSLTKYQIGQISRWNDDVNHALIHLNEALTQAKKIGHETLLTMIETELAGAYLQQTDYIQAQMYLDTALECALKLEQPPLLLNVLSVLIQLAIMKGVINDSVKRVACAVVTHQNGSHVMQLSMRYWLNNHNIYFEENMIHKLTLEDIHCISKQMLEKD